MTAAILNILYNKLIKFKLVPTDTVRYKYTVHTPSELDN